MKSNFGKNLLAGVGSVLNINPSLPKNPVSEKTDSERLYSDWQKVGNNLRWSIKQVDDEQRRK